MKRYLPFIIIAAVLAAALGAGTFLFRTAQPQPAATPLLNATPAPTPAVAKNAVLIEEYGDYQCPPCGTLHPIVKQLKSEFGNRVEFVFYHLPLVQIHKNALPAARAAVAAGLQGRFWEMHNKLYESQQMWSEAADMRPFVVGLAQQLGLDAERLLREMDSGKVKAVVSADMQRADALRVNSTPTVFIDGRPIENENLTLENLRRGIELRLSSRR